MAPKLIPVVVSGGAGTRLWPLSTEALPKQFHRLGSPNSLFQETVARLESVQGLTLEPPILMCGVRHATLAQEQLEAMGCTPAATVLEPFGRNTAAVAMAASLVAEEMDPTALVLMAPSDHAMSRPAAFGKAIEAAASLASEYFVLFGVVPTAPETGYGYIEIGEAIGGDASRVARFVEKPNLEVARSYVTGGRHLWNSGIFLFSPRLMIAEMDRLAPDVANATRQALSRGVRRGPVIALDAEAFQACPSISLDYAVMERTDKAAVAPMGADWSDIGSWDSVWHQGPQDALGNALHGPAALIDTENCLVWSEGKMVAGIGLRDLVIVQTADAVLVLPRSRSQDVKLLVEQMRARAVRPEGDHD